MSGNCQLKEIFDTQTTGEDTWKLLYFTRPHPIGERKEQCPSPHLIFSNHLGRSFSTLQRPYPAFNKNLSLSEETHQMIPNLACAQYDVPRKIETAGPMVPDFRKTNSGIHLALYICSGIGTLTQRSWDLPHWRANQFKSLLIDMTVTVTSMKMRLFVPEQR